MKKRSIYTISLLAVGVAFLVIGVFAYGGEQVDAVLQKAIMICMECIGLG